MFDRLRETPSGPGGPTLSSWNRFYLSGMGSELRAAFEHELRGQTTTMFFALVSVVLTMAALAFAPARFT